MKQEEKPGTYKKEYRRAKIEEIETNSNIKNIRDLRRESKEIKRVTTIEIIYKGVCGRFHCHYSQKLLHTF